MVSAVHLAKTEREDLFFFLGLGLFGCAGEDDIIIYHKPCLPGNLLYVYEY